MTNKYRNLAMMAAVLFATTPTVTISTASRRREDPDAECESYGSRAAFDNERTQEQNERAQVSKKRHKKKVIHVQHKAVPSQKVSKFFERVTDPDREKREAMQAKDPFGRMEGRW